MQKLDANEVTRPARRAGLNALGWVAGLPFLVAISACATGAPSRRADQDPRPATRIEMEPITLHAVRTPHGVTVEAKDAAGLFEEAKTASEASLHADAARLYFEIQTAFPDSSYVPAAVYNLGIVYQDQKRWQKAAEQFALFVTTYPDSGDVKNALFLRGLSLAEAGAWADSEAQFADLLARDDMTADDKVEAMTRRGVARFNQNDLDGTEAAMRNVFAFKVRLETTREERLDTNYYLALAQFVMAQVSHKRSLDAPLRWPESQMSDDLEAKATLLLEARRRYIAAVRYGNARVATMAAYQIGNLFQEFYDAIISVPPPRDLNGKDKAEVREIYVQELRKKLRNVLEKSLRGHEHNLELFERLGVENEWVIRSRDAIERLRHLLDPSTDLEDPSDVATPDQKDPTAPPTERQEKRDPDGPKRHIL